MGTRQWKLTVIELFVIAVLLAAVGSVAVWKYRQDQTLELAETMKDDLRNLRTAQEGYAADNGGLFMPPNSRVTTTTHYYGYAPSSGVTVNIAEPGPASWSATATHERVPGVICGIFVGEAPPTPPNPATEPGDPACN